MIPLTPLKYTLVGASGIAVNLSVLILLKEYLAVPVLLANIAAITVSILTNFILNDRWTFVDVKARKRFHHRLSAFIAVSLFGMALNTAVFSVLISAGVYYIAASLIAIAIVFAWNYIANKNVTWKCVS